MRTFPLLLALSMVPVASAHASSRISPSRYAARADAACAAADAKVARLTQPTSADGIEGYYAQALPIARSLLRGLLAIPLPSARASTVVRALTILEQENTLSERFVAQLQGGADPGSSFAAYGKKIDPLDTKLNAAWRAVGAATCAS